MPKWRKMDFRGTINAVELCLPRAVSVLCAWIASNSPLPVMRDWEISAICCTSNITIGQKIDQKVPRKIHRKSGLADYNFKL